MSGTDCTDRAILDRALPYQVAVNLSDGDLTKARCADFIVETSTSVLVTSLPSCTTLLGIYFASQICVMPTGSAVTSAASC